MGDGLVRISHRRSPQTEWADGRSDLGGDFNDMPGASLTDVEPASIEKYVQAVAVVQAGLNLRRWPAYDVRSPS